MSDNNSRQGRQLRSTPQQFCTRDDGDDLIIEGYFAVFDSPYVLWDGATEIVKPGAFAGCLSGDIRALIDHDTRLVLGRTKAGTLTLREDARGLRSVMEQSLIGIMYEIPSDPTIIKVTVDEETVNGAKPKLEYGAVRKRYKALASGRVN